MIQQQVKLLHLSDIHCGRPYTERHVEAAIAVAQSREFNAIIVSGDFSQRARAKEFKKARIIIDRLNAIAPVLVVPGNHDAQWWRSPFGFGDPASVNERYREFIQQELEPELRVPGATIVGVNSAPGVMPWTLTWNPRDLRVKGGLTDAQLYGAKQRLAAAPVGDLRVLVVHHNVVRGRLSNRWGMAQPQRILDGIADMKAHIVCSGHDHEERIEIIERRGRKFMVSTSNTLSSRMRGHRPSAFNTISFCNGELSAKSWTFDSESSSFVEGDAVSMHCPD